MTDTVTPWDWLTIPPAHHQAHAENVWRRVTIGDLARQRALESPDFVAMVDGDVSLTFAQWLAQAQRLAATLHARGLRRGDVVAFQLPNWHEAAVINLACALSGLVVNPIVPIYRDSEVRQMLGDCGAKAIFTCTMFRNFDYAELARGLRSDLERLDHVFTVRGAGDDDYAALIREDAAARPYNTDADPFGVKLILYTSGTTGRPKGVLHSHSTLENIIRRSAEHWGICAGEATLMPSPVTHISGYANGLELPLVCGTCTVLMESWNAEDAARLIEAHRIVGTVAATPFLAELADVARKLETRLPSMRYFACGGAAVPPELIPLANAAFDNLRAFRVFGASEVPLVTFGWPDDELRAATTDGQVVDYEVKITDDHGNSVPAGEEGEILARGPAMMLGYADQEQTRAAIDPEGFFRTGDLGRLDGNGALTVTGRKKDLIIRGGENISAVEIEDVLRQHPAVRDTAVVAMPHARLGEGICAFVIAQGEPPAAADLARFVMDSGLARQKTPEHFEFVADLPRTASGKVRKDILRRDIRAKLAD